jgi:hypothetical protein
MSNVSLMWIIRCFHGMSQSLHDPYGPSGTKKKKNNKKRTFPPSDRIFSCDPWS